MTWPFSLCSGPFSTSEIVFQLYPVDDETPENRETWSLKNEWNYGKCNMSKWNQFQCWNKWMWILFKIEYNRIYLTGSVFYVANQIFSALLGCIFRWFHKRNPKIQLANSKDIFVCSKAPFHIFTTKYKYFFTYQGHRQTSGRRQLRQRLRESQTPIGFQQSLDSWRLLQSPSHSGKWRWPASHQQACNWSHLTWIVHRAQGVGPPSQWWQWERTGKTTRISLLARFFESGKCNWYLLRLYSRQERVRIWLYNND